MTIHQILQTATVQEFPEHHWAQVSIENGESISGFGKTREKALKELRRNVKVHLRRKSLQSILTKLGLN